MESRVIPATIVDLGAGELNCRLLLNFPSLILLTNVLITFIIHINVTPCIHSSNILFKFISVFFSDIKC